MQARDWAGELAPHESNDQRPCWLWATIHKALWDVQHKREYLDVAIDTFERAFWWRHADLRSGAHFAFLLNARAADSSDHGPDAIADFVLADRTRQKLILMCQRRLADESVDPD